MYYLGNFFIYKINPNLNRRPFCIIDLDGASIDRVNYRHTFIPQKMKKATF